MVMDPLQNMRIDTLARGLAYLEFRTDGEAVGLRGEFLGAMTDVRLNSVTPRDEELVVIASRLVWPGEVA